MATLKTYSLQPATVDLLTIAAERLGITRSELVERAIWADRRLTAVAREAGIDRPDRSPPGRRWDEKRGAGK